MVEKGKEETFENVKSVLEKRIKSTVLALLVEAQNSMPSISKKIHPRNTERKRNMMLKSNCSMRK
jgi:hypothetical protein